MNYFAKLVEKRRSIRDYNTKKRILSPEVKKQIIKVALMSPTSKNSRPWQFILVENEEMLKNLSACKASGAAFIANCALAIIVLSDPSQSEAYIEDAAIAASYIQLQVEDLKLGSCWIHVRERKTANGHSSEQYIRNLLNIPLHLCVECIISIGYKAKEIKSHDEEKLQWEKLHIGNW
ncbi:nitroreductase family protein [Candidatus Azobacteroides pseudotrichonymphae]|uniref:Nitroreductase family protein n=1 Tax=Azobacteroides pseudotrichonymphae genomovar. CFP2 TaxID=511995 RepID=B6YQF0_AZOPC|nr:nitroreductase family protein [Candidatus Azobacteroides pseudotrichonymphae]BAG83422.1 putative nitroreductase family protein [Candidatus Azobacteroides pseudotrichonymphae genomovar. CFP2]